MGCFAEGLTILASGVVGMAWVLLEWIAVLLMVIGVLLN